MMGEQSDLFTPSVESLGSHVREVVLDLLSRLTQPSAWELVEHIERQAGLKARWEIKPVLTKLVIDSQLTRLQKSYLSSVLETGDLSQALDGEEPPRRQIESTIDDLLRNSAVYRFSDKFQETVSFMARFREYAPYNNMLVRTQNPSCGFYATEKDWHERFGRTLKEDARPMLILAPMHPVMLVYDLDQTNGPPLPQELQDFAHFEGEWDSGCLKRTVANAARHDRIRIDFKTLSSTHAGFATIARGSDDWKMRIAIHDGLDEASRFGVLCHELAHIFCGHLGSDRDHWWPSRISLDHHVIEIEAEAAAHVVTARFGLEGASATYVSRHLKIDRPPKAVSLDMIAKVAGRIERMARESLPSRQPRRSEATA